MVGCVHGVTPKNISGNEILTLTVQGFDILFRKYLKEDHKNAFAEKLIYTCVSNTM